MHRAAVHPPRAMLRVVAADLAAAVEALHTQVVVAAVVVDRTTKAAVELVEGLVVS